MIVSSNQFQEAGMISDNLKPKAMAKWRAIINAQEVSGITIDAYCKAKGICRSSFYGYRKQLRHPIVMKPGFLKLTPVAEANMFMPVASCETPISIRTPNGYQIGLKLPNENGLAKIFGILKSL